MLLVITRGERGGAQLHVHSLVLGLRDRVAYTVAVGDETFLAPALRASGVDVRVIPSLQRSVSPLSDGRTLGALGALIRAVRPQLVHTHSSKAGVLGRAAAWMAGLPAIHTAHAWSFSDGLSRRRRALTIPVEAFSGRLTSRFIVVSEADREVGTRWGVARSEQIRVVHNGVPDVSERARPGDDVLPTVTMVARLAAPKDPLLLLRALRGIDLPFAVQLVGDGPDRAAVEAGIRSYLLQDRVRLLGAREDIPALLAASHVGLLVSRQEGFPLVVLEAMRAGLPVIASDVGGVREAVADGVTGVLVPRGDATALGAALARLTTEPRLRETLGLAGRRAFEDRFTVEKMLSATLRVYGEVVA